MLKAIAFIISRLLATVVAALLFMIPFAIIWSINVLFPAAKIPYNLNTWTAAVILIIAVRPDIIYKKVPGNTKQIAESNDTPSK